MVDYTILAADRDGGLVGEMDTWNRLSIVVPFNAPPTGVFELAWKYRAMVPVTNQLKVYRNGEPFLAFEVTERSRGYSSGLVVGGVGTLQRLAEYVVLPVFDGPPYTGSSHDVRTGDAATVIKDYVKYTLTSYAKTGRDCGIAVAAPSVLGFTVTGRARFVPLLSLCQDLAVKGGGLGFAVDADNLFDVYQPEDKTSGVEFSTGLGNLVDYTIREIAPKANYIIVGGQNAGTARTFYERGDNNSILAYGRKELFADRRDTDDGGEHEAEVVKRLDEGRYQEIVTVSVQDTEAVAFKDDYFVGDKVAVVADGDTYEDIVREVRIEVDGTKNEVISFDVGTGSAFGGVFGQEQIKDINTRLKRLEAV